MKNSSSLFIPFLLLILLSSCDYEHVRAQDEVTSRNLSLSGYNGLKVSNAFDVFVTFTDSEESIIIEANDNLHDRIIVAREGDDLIIKLKKFTSIKGRATLKAYIKTKNIEDFDLRGASTVILENLWETDRGEIELAGSSEFRGEVAINHLEVDMSGASKAEIYGASQSMYADLSGASDIRDYDLVTRKLNIELSGASEAFLSATETIDIEASGASILNYKGDAEVHHKELRGSSQIKNRN
ncbi:DUF2807 domain-containing protein [Euzebyella marina]|uniref:DUF2807 domain-containing protein n=1 Tax=Euzebyella marina TaxID=1761453 RepID=A0A3G2L773_9FLAO|nr:head GIN domain-containing protein [Euzebyella marina]AYN68033.1 DUF2807 domain-containing protein [Euzebyella marina]